MVISHDDDQIVLVADGNYIIVNLPSQKALDKLTSGGGSGKSGGGGALKTLDQINDIVLAMKLVVDVRVAGKTYVEFGTGSRAKITASAIFGKIGSFFTR